MENNKIVEQEDIILEGNSQAVAEGSDQQQVQSAAQQTPKTFTQEEVDAMVAGRLARERSKHEQNMKREYGPLMDVLTAGTGKTTPREIAEHLKAYYQGQGATLPEQPAFSERDIAILAQADAKEIISFGADEVKDEVARLEKLGEDGRSPKENALLRVLAEHQQAQQRRADFLEHGITEQELESADFQALVDLCSASTPAEKICEHYRLLHPKQDIQTMGSLNNTPTDTKGIKDFYTPEDVDRLTAADYKNPTIMQRVRESMLKWKE